MTTSLHDRLRRLHREEALTSGHPAEPGGALGRLERALGTESPEEVSLKVRLERLVAVASMQRPRVEHQAEAPIRLEEAVQGARHQNERGEYFVVDHDVHIDTFHGQLSLSRFLSRRPGEVSVLSGEPDFHDFDLSRAVFLDTETTGLSGGTGTAAFLIGIGFLDGDRFRVRQFFMRDYHEEPALLHGLAQDLARFDRVVTFNGKMFDVPLLETRYRLARTRFPLQRMPHLDLLHPARRLFKLRHESCRLTALETALLGVRRQGDIPGHEIPWVYFEYVRRRDARAIQKVLEHNRLDIVSLAALCLYACDWVFADDADDPRDAYSLGRVLDRAGLHDRALAHYRKVADTDDGVLRVRSLLRLARHARRAGEFDEAVALWTTAAEAGEPLAWRSLAIYYERRAQDPQKAFRAVESGLALVRSGEGPRSRRVRADLLARHTRLSRRLACDNASERGRKR